MNVLITGVSKGIGAALLKLCEEDARIKKIFACTSSDFKSTSSKTETIYVNFTEEFWIDTIAEHILDTPIDILINNAGYLICHEFDGFDEVSARNIFEINYWAPVKIIKLLIPNLKSSSGHVVNIGSMGGVQGSSKFPGLSHYSSSKGALAIATECLTAEYASQGIVFNYLALGAVDTEMLADAFPGYNAEMTPKEMAAFIYSFCFNAKKVMNGSIVNVSTTTPS